MGSGKIQERFETVSALLDDVPETMRKFSLGMRGVFTENAVGTSSSTARRFRRLRDDTRNDAVVYVKGVLPVVKQCVSDIKSYFEYYEDLTMDDWWQNIDYIIEETETYKQACDALAKIHEDFMTELNRREDGARILMSEMTDLSAECRKRAQELQESAASKNAWASRLLFVPLVNLIATPLLRRSANGDQVASDGKKEGSRNSNSCSRCCEKDIGFCFFKVQ